MSNYLRTEDGFTDPVLSTVTLEDIEKAYGARLERTVRLTQTWHSGLPLTWSGSEPAVVATTRRRSFELAVKRAFDVVVAFLALAGLLPLLLLVALVIKVSSPGPVLFRQAREGINGSHFDVFKFRSMRIDVCDPSGVAQTRENDVRVTGIGRFIRRTSIDELPQLLNVLRGEMSLIGPRPHVPGMYAGGTVYKKLVPYYDARLAVLPGLSGWAQANGLRGLTTDADSARARIDHDIAYVQNFSFILDLKIIVMTVWREFVTGSGH